MPNLFKDIFESLSKESDFVRFGRLPVKQNVLGGNIIEIMPSVELVESSMAIAKEKALKTMASNQNLDSRTMAEKINQSCRGVLGEASVHLLLAKQLGISLNKIRRFDLERDSFDYSTSEYDLEINESRIEVRTSNNPTPLIHDFLNLPNRGVICTYTNKLKSFEKSSDFYFGVVYDYPGLRGPLTAANKLSFDSDILEKRLRMYLVAGVNNAEKEKYGVVSQMGQSNTSYQIVPFAKCRNIFEVIEELGSKF